MRTNGAVQGKILVIGFVTLLLAMAVVMIGYWLRENGVYSVRMEVLRPDADASRVALEVENSRALHLYVFFEGSDGAATLLFPRDADGSDPLPAGTHRLPNSDAGSGNWTLPDVEWDGALLLVASPVALIELEGELRKMGNSGAAGGVPISDVARKRVRALRDTRLGQAPPPDGRLTSLAPPLSTAPENARGIWMRKAALKVPVP